LYDGKDIELSITYNNHTESKMDIELYIFVNSTFQPFIVEGTTGKGKIYDFSLNAVSSKTIKLIFTPLSADRVNDSNYSFESSISTSSTQSFVIATTDISPDIKASADAYDVSFNPETNDIGKEYDKHPKDDNVDYTCINTPTKGNYHFDADYDNSVNEFVYSMKKSDQFCMDIESQYDDTYPTNNFQTAFLTVDGRIVKAFQGKYFVTWTQKKGKYYEFPIDKSVIPSIGKHEIYIHIAVRGDTARWGGRITITN
jgi:hypothetical protein